MKAKIISLLISMLLICVTAASVTGTTNDFFNEDNPEGCFPCYAPWDFQFSFDASTPIGDTGIGGVEFDGTHFYVTKWNGPNIYQFDKDGNYIGSFTISGVTNLRDLAYDGTYFYGGDGTASRIWELDLASQTLVSTITTPVGVRSCAYDADADGGNGGFWINIWDSDLVLVDRTGSQLDTIPSPPSLYGTAWDDVCTVEGFNGPFLWIFTGTSGTTCQIEQYDLATKTLTGVTHSVSGDLGDGIAGGLFFTTDYNDSYATLGGLIQGTPRTVFGYEMCELNAPPAVPDAPDGPITGATGIEYTFTATTTDPEGEEIYYKFDWGNGEFSDWIGPYSSGTTGEGSFTWIAAGTYDVKVMAKDAGGRESDWSAPHTIEIAEGPIMDIRPLSSGLFRVKATIENDGAVEATDVAWTISLVGGAFIGAESSGTIASIPPGGSVEVQSGFILGLGATTITVTAEVDPGVSDTRQHSGTILLFFIKINPGGG